MENAKENSTPKQIDDVDSESGNVIVKRRGRPPKGENKKVVKEKTQSNIDPTFLANTISSYITIVDGTLCRSLYASAFYIFGNAEEATKVAKEAGMTIEERDFISKTSAELIIEYGWAAKYIREALLAFTVTCYGIRQGMAVWRLKEARKSMTIKAKDAIVASNNATNPSTN